MARSSPWSCSVVRLRGHRLVDGRHVQDRREIEAGRLPVIDCLLHVEQLRPADRLVERAEPQGGEQRAHLLGDVLEEGLDELGLAREPLPEDRVLRRDAHGAGVEVAHPHHDAAADDERGSGEAVLLGPEQRGDDDVAPGLELAVGLHDDPVAQAVEQQGLLGLGEAQLPRRPGVLERGERRGARPPSWPEIRTTSACALATPAATVPTPTSDTSFTCTRARGLAFFRSWISWARSSIE